MAGEGGTGLEGRRGGAPGRATSGRERRALERRGTPGSGSCGCCAELVKDLAGGVGKGPWGLTRRLLQEQHC